MNDATIDRFDRFLTVLRRLQEAKIPHTLTDHRDDAVSILAFAPGEYWEIDFLADGDIDVERFRSKGEIEDGTTVLEDLFAAWADDEPPASVVGGADATSAGK